METKAVSRYNRISAVKARLVANEIRGFSFPEAIDILRAIPRKASKLLMKTLYSAAAGAKYRNPEIRENNLYIKKIVIDEGPTMKRFRPRARGRASRIRKRLSTIEIVLSDEN
ncbi:MAG TPA: 50S ribosomal protein L22 [Spirochaetota bacterium]|jgi:large subunit ribosomal protein L22|nr:50S ribosomal protein L22 [Spirochaetota bacterium]HOR93623.1 50S ribosomal protein L22 [Spirochaetota bacterium]HOT18871.1 50S ribosomal protein L22 [Spirochaetota bacterium]HPD04819.1 50S ribosomal protein L22 [Spirochaetota bacterium]HPK45628.1 50S ribosomal protein L22 [Spirochaetota bacterium]